MKAENRGKRIRDLAERYLNMIEPICNHNADEVSLALIAAGIAISVVGGIEMEHLINAVGVMIKETYDRKHNVH